MTEDALVGKTLEKCFIVRKLGTGGMGSVYLAEHAGLDRQVAVKILPADMQRDPEYVARFIREATMAGRLQHPNIIQIFDVGHAEERHFMVMQYVDGEPLSSLVERRGALEPALAARMAAGILRGLHHAHQQGVIHRDVKPDNVLLAPGAVPMLLDFGLAIESENSLKLTRDGLVVGTPFYLSPEQARGHKATPKSDVYSAGITLYYILTGKRPFNGPTALAVLNKQIREVPVPPVQHNPDIPRALNDIVLKMMSKRPDDRYATAGEAADAIESFLAGREVKVDLPRPVPWLTLPVKIGAGVAAAFLLAGILLALVLPGGNPPAPPPPAAGIPLPPPPSGIAPSAELDAIVNFQLEQQDNLAAFAGILKRYDDFLRAPGSSELAARAQRHRDGFRRQVESAARDEVARIPADPDPERRLKALEAFPSDLIDLTEAGATVKRERERLTAAIVDRAAREANEEERLRQLERAYGRVRGEFAAALARREIAAAYGHVADFVRKVPEKTGRFRVPGVDYGPLLALVPDSTLADPKLAEARAALGAAWSRAEDRLPWHLLADLQDALDVETILRRAAKGLDKLLAGGGEVALSALGFKGRVNIGPAGLVLRRGETEKPIVVRDLHPRDLLTLAEAAGETDALLARAAGAAHLHSNAPDRYSGAARWLGLAARQGAPGPAWRLDGLRDLARKEIRERAGDAKHVAEAGRLDEADRELSELLRFCEDDPDVREEVSRLQAGVLLLSLEAAAKAGNTARVKETGHRLRKEHPGRYDEASVAPRVHAAILASGHWRRADPSLKTDSWTWEGRAQGASPPALDDRHEGFRVTVKRTLLVSAARWPGVSGLSAQARINVEARSSHGGIVFDVQGGRHRLLSLDAAGRAALFEVEGAVAPRLVSAIDTGKKTGTWVDLACIIEDGEAVCYVEKKAVFTANVAPRPDPGFGLWAELDANFREIHFRR